MEHVTESNLSQEKKKDQNQCGSNRWLMDIYRNSLGLNLSCNEVTIKTFCTGFTNAKTATIQANIIFTVMIRIFLISGKDKDKKRE